MQLLRRLFGPVHRNACTIKEGHGGSLPATSVLDIFGEDLRHIRISTFNEGKSEVEANGDIVRNYYKELPSKEYDLFDTMQVKLMGASINVVFKSCDPRIKETAGIKKIIDSLYDLYGDDSTGKGRYNADDAADYRDKHFDVFFGRDWMDYSRYPYPVAIRRSARETFVSIWGLSRNNIIQ
jgi:hypothetical protein